MDWLCHGPGAQAVWDQIGGLDHPRPGHHHGRAKSSKAIAKIVQDLMGKGFMILLCDEVIEQLLEENMKMGVDYIAFPVGNFTQIIHAVNFALRAGLAFGGISPAAGKRSEIISGGGSGLSSSS